MFVLRVNTQRLLILGMLVVSAAALGIRFVTTNTTEAFAYGWVAFGLTLMLCREKK